MTPSLWLCLTADTTPPSEPRGQAYVTQSWSLLLYVTAFTSERGGLYKNSVNADTVKSYRWRRRRDEGC